MPRYRALLLGRNFLLARDGRTAKYGFSATCGIEAEDPALAEERAVRLVEAAAELKDRVLNAHEDPPLIFLQELAHIGSGGDGHQDVSFEFFPEDDAPALPSLDLD